MTINESLSVFLASTMWFQGEVIYTSTPFEEGGITFDGIVDSDISIPYSILNMG